MSRWTLKSVICCVSRPSRRETAAGNWKQIWNLEEFELEMKVLVSSSQRCYDKPRKQMKPLEGEKKQIENRSLGNI